jgi:Flp pilus assembly pilin Flp
MKNLIQRFVRDEDGQDIIEYALLAAFVSICAIAAILLIRPQIQTLYGNVQAALSH